MEMEWLYSIVGRFAAFHDDDDDFSSSWKRLMETPLGLGRVVLLVFRVLGSIWKFSSRNYAFCCLVFQGFEVRIRPCCVDYF